MHAILSGIKPELEISRKVAIIGNSDKLLTRDYSKLIDTYDEVIRFNFGDIRSQYTGKKTTIRWINCNINIADAKEHNQEITDIYSFRRYINQRFTGIKIIAWDSLKDELLKYNKDLEIYRPNSLCTLSNINEYLNTLPEIKSRFDAQDNCWPRTGFQAILTCIKSGCTPHLFGFDIKKRKEYRHYSLNNKYIVDKVQQHQINREIDILNELIKHKYIYVF